MDEKKWPVIDGDYIIDDPQSSIAITTTSEIYRKIKTKCAIKGKVETENDGIQRIIANIISNPHIRALVICDKEVVGHRPLSTLINLHKNGVDPETGKILGPEEDLGAIPYIGKIPPEAVERFARQVEIISLEGISDPEKIDRRLGEMNLSKELFSEPPIFLDLVSVELPTKIKYTKNPVTYSDATIFHPAIAELQSYNQFPIKSMEDLEKRFTDFLPSIKSIENFYQFGVFEKFQTMYSHFKKNMRAMSFEGASIFRSYVEDLPNKIIERISKHIKTVEVGNVKFGGLEGNPSVLIPTIFYKGHRILLGPEKGKFDENLAEELIRSVEEKSRKTGIPYGIDVYASSPQAMENEIEFVLQKTYNTPIFVDGQDYETKMSGVKVAESFGEADRIVYNSLDSTRLDEILKLKKSPVETVVILNWGAEVQKNPSVESRERELVNVLNVVKSKLKSVNCLIDTAVLAPYCGAGQGMNLCGYFKAKYGWPSGCGPHNLYDSHPIVRNMGKEERKTKRMALSAAVMGYAIEKADFILTGPIEGATVLMEAAAVLESAKGEWYLNERGVKLPKNHPYFKFKG